MRQGWCFSCALVVSWIAISFHLASAISLVSPSWLSLHHFIPTLTTHKTPGPQFHPSHTLYPRLYLRKNWSKGSISLTGVPRGCFLEVPGIQTEHRISLSWTHCHWHQAHNRYPVSGTHILFIQMPRPLLGFQLSAHKATTSGGLWTEANQTLCFSEGKI